MGAICQVAAVNKISGFILGDGVVTTRVGGNVTLHCLHQNDGVTFLTWYQQSLGGKPVIISSQMTHQTDASISPAFKERFRVLAQEGNNNLTIHNIRPSDSATYYCGILEFNAIVFGQGVFLHVKKSSSSIQSVFQQPALEPLWVGNSVNLSCTAYAETCAGERSFYWFRHGAAQPAIIYHSAGLCMNDSESTMKTCTLYLGLKSVSSSDAGMYYCALASCGEIVFGQGTRVEIAGSAKAPQLLVHCLSVALAVSIIVLLILAFFAYKLKKKLCSICKETVSHLTGSAASDAMSQDADILHYAALSVNRTSERHRQEKSAESDCVYSRVKSRK
uniref:uncharacterized protein n=1 Tax=Semicossyphus pulcher TaxID=241346 RepID=UPI0037E76B87